MESVDEGVKRNYNLNDEKEKYDIDDLISNEYAVMKPMTFK